MNRRRTPKVFFSSYKPKKRPSANEGAQYKQLAVVFLIIVGGYFVTRLPVFQIKTITVEGIDNSQVESRLNELIGQSILSGAVNDAVYNIRTDHIDLLNLHCDKGIPDTLRCRGEQREPILAWVTSGEKYLIDSAGVAFKIAGDSLGAKDVRDQSDVAVELGDQVLSEDMVSIYVGILEDLLANSFVVSSMFVNKSSLYPGVVLSSRQDNKPFTPKSIEVVFSTSYPTETQVKLLSQLIETKAGLINERVDLRTPGYVYYK